MRIYRSYKEAHEALHIKGSYQRGTIGTPIDGITSVKLTANPSSLDRISKDLNKIYYVGVGKKSSQGQPAVDQRREDQQAFFTSYRTQNPFPVLIKLKANTVLYAGNYVVKKIHERMSPQQIVYFHIELEKLDNRFS